MGGDERVQDDCPIPRRFTVSQRIEHLVLFLSFTMLSVTGLVQKYPMNPTSDHLMTLMGGVQTTRILHRVAAVLLALLGVYHFLAVAYKYYVSRVRMTMVPTAGDVQDVWHSLCYNLSLRKDPPQMPRYNFAEKLEYWALIWGGIIMVITGFMLWNPLITTKFLPGQFIPAAKAAHGGEAVLAVLAIIVWHFYHVHVRIFNKSMFTGKLTRHQMEEEHGAEWSEIKNGASMFIRDPDSLRRRQIIFTPIALVVGVLGIAGIYWAATAEATAISTVPMQVYSTPIYSPENPAVPQDSKRSVVAAPGIPHPIAGQEKCYACHGKTGMKPVPTNHEGRPIESCQVCHRLSPAPKTKEPVEEKKAAAVPKPIPHAIEAPPYKNCINCHGPGKIKPSPKNHAAFPVESCTGCHKPASSK